MTTAIRELQERVARLEQELASLQTRLIQDRAEPWWRRFGEPPPDPSVYDEFLLILQQQSDADLAARCAKLDEEDAAATSARKPRRRKVNRAREAR